jgi:hypothetical protein
MIESSTLELLILYLFNETMLTESVIVQQEIDTNYLVNEQYNEMVETLNYVDAMVTAPSSRTVSNILEYSRSLSN